MNKRLVLIALLLALLLTLSDSLNPAWAQTSASISVLPAESTLDLALGSSAQLQIYVADVADLNGFDVTIEYNSAVLTLASWTHGGILTNLFRFAEQNVPGRLRLAFAQLQRPGFTGSGVLLFLNFTASTEGVSSINITQNGLYQSDGTPINPTVHNGVFKAVRTFSVSGDLGVEYGLVRSGIPLALVGGSVFNAGPYSATTGGQEGSNFSIPQVVRDTYILTTAQPRCLNLTEALGKSFGMASGNTTLAPLTLLRGNAAWTNNTIDSGDVSVVGTYWGLTPADLEPGDSLDGDVNFDGVVDLRDLAIVAGNFGLTSALVYAGWTP